MSEIRFGDVAVSEVMNTELPVIEKGAGVCQVARMLRHASHVWVVEERGSRVVLGIVTVHQFMDLLSPLPAGEYATGVIKPRSLYLGQLRTAEEVMSRPVVSCGPATKVEEALELLRERDIRRLAVVEGGEIVGELSPKGVIAAYYIDSCGMRDSS